MTPLPGALIALGVASALGSCTGGDRASATNTAPDGGVDADTGVHADGSGGSVQPDACQGKPCGACECGPIDDGCGHIVQCEPCPPLLGCDKLYGEVVGFQLCEETEQQCTFRAIKIGQVSCADICEAHGGQCLASYANGVGCGGIEYADGGLGCDAKANDDDVCVCDRAANVQQPGLCADASVPPDAEPPSDAGPPKGSTLLYRVNFEDGTTNADPGVSHEETAAGNNTGGKITAVNNPHKDSRNPSNKVGRHQVPAGYQRAELSSQRLTTVDRTYIYKVSYYIPTDFFAHPIATPLISQWKTWPCSKGNDAFADKICDTGGIFDDLIAQVPHFRFKYRAKPDCDRAYPPMLVDQWVNLVEEVHWATDDTGHARVWQNGQLIWQRFTFRTLFPGLTVPDCDMYWSVGVYKSSDTGVELYTDNIEIWKP
jgi:hypothetical protein